MATPSPNVAAPDADAAPPLAAREVLVHWLPHLLSLWIPGNALLFVVTGPHPWFVAPLFMLPLVLAHRLDTSGRVERRPPPPDLPAWPFDALVYLLAGLQLVTVALWVALFATESIFTVDALFGLLIVGGSSGYAIITAHELIHRRKRWEQQLGRLLLCSVLYEHFYTEHLRGHHVRVGTPDDPATARFGESFHAFYRRTVPAQFRSAWRLEKKRLGDESMSNLDPRMLRHRCVHGLVLGWGTALAAGLAFGPGAAILFVLQGVLASRLLEVVNYFEHWGLERTSRRVRPADSWDTHSWFTYYALIGLSRHADHHAWAARPYQQLRVWEEPAILPAGYIGMVTFVLMDNARFQRRMTAELERKQLGPFRPKDEAGASAAGLSPSPTAA
ncbi:MAG: fatty acid desaturase [Myxococcota bacterium]